MVWPGPRETPQRLLDRLVTDATGEVTTLSYATAKLTTPTAVAGPILNSSFSATIEGTDIASGLDFEYDYASSAQTLVVQQPGASVPTLTGRGLAVLASLMALTAFAAVRRRLAR